MNESLVDHIADQHIVSRVEGDRQVGGPPRIDLLKLVHDQPAESTMLPTTLVVRRSTGIG